MSAQQLKTRIVHKHDLEVNWLKAKTFVPLKGELIIYDVEVDENGNTLALPEGRSVPYLFERFKIGDGVIQQDGTVKGTNVTALPFTVNPHTHPEATIEAAGLMSATDKQKLIGIASGAEVNVQSDWNETNTSSDAYIKNKPNALKNPNALSIGGKSYDGSSVVTLTAAELRAHLGIDKALHFIGLTTTAITDNATTKTITVDEKDYTAAAGDVVLYNDNEYVFDGSKWLELGDGSSHALKTNNVTAGSGLTGGGQIGSNPTLNVGQGNGITVTADSVAAKAGNGITVDSTGINHADTSSQASVTASGRKYITGVTLDTYGHVTGLTTGTETVTDTHNSHTVISGKKADGSTDIKGSASAGDITLGDSGVTAGEYGPTANATPGYGAIFNVPDIKVNAKGIVTSVVNRTVKIPASDNTDTNQKIKAGSVTFNANDEVNIVAGQNVTVTGNASNKTVTIGTNFDLLISSGVADPTEDTASQYYFKY